MKKIKLVALCLLLTLSLVPSAFAATFGEMYENGVVSDGNVTFGDARDGIVSDVSEGENILGDGGRLEEEMTKAGDMIKDGIDGLADKAKSGVDMVEDGVEKVDDAMGGTAKTVAIVVAVIVAIAVVVVIFLLIPKRK